MNYHGPVIGMFGGCHRSNGFIGAAIMVFTTWAWRWFKPIKVSTHSSVGFIYEDGYREIFEAREGKSWQGPIPVHKVDAWVARNPSKRRFTMYDIPDYLIPMEIALLKRLRCISMLEVWIYSLKQLPRMGLRKWLPFLPMKPTPNKVVCSEAAALILDPDCSILKTTGKSKADLIHPADFERALKIITAKPKHEIAETQGAYNE